MTNYLVDNVSHRDLRFLVQFCTLCSRWYLHCEGAQEEYHKLYRNDNHNHTASFLDVGKALGVDDGVVRLKEVLCVTSTTALSTTTFESRSKYFIHFTEPLRNLNDRQSSCQFLTSSQKLRPISLASVHSIFTTLQ